MLPVDALSPDDEQLLPLVVAMADGALVDWSNAPPPLVRQLQHLERIIRGHEAVKSSPSRHAAAAHDTLLTEARRKSDPAENPLHVRWGPLVVHEKIGRGSFGDVYRAWDPRLEREVALKLIPQFAPEESASPVVEEARLLARVRHPNIMVVYGAERVDGRVGIWTEYIHGETLASEVARRGPRAAEEAARIGADVCAALGAVHAAGLLHRDVKAQNIMRDATGRVALGDFGTGIELADNARVSDAQIAGTPLYLAPEVIDGQPATIGSDLYGVGVLLFFLVTGTYPVSGCTLAEIKRAHTLGQRVSVGTARDDLPGGLVDVIEKLLSTSPGQRYATAAAAQMELESCIAGPTSPAPSSRRRVVAPAVAGAIGLFAVLAGAIWQPRSPDVLGDAPQSTAAFALKPGDWVLVADAENRTGEAIFDGTLRAAIERELEYSDYLRVVQRDRIGDALHVLRRPLDSRVDRNLALELSRRDGAIHAVIAVAISKASTGYELTFDVVNPVDRRRVTSLMDHAAGHAEILGATRRQMLRVRERLREPPASVERSRDALKRAALPSLKAMHLGAQARAVIETSRGNPAVSEWGRIEQIARAMIEEAPSYATGYGLRGWAMTLQGRRDEGLAAMERALQLADTATPQERYLIIATRHQFKGWDLDGPPAIAERAELEQAAAALEALFALQPTHDVFRSGLRNIYQALGRERDVAWTNLRVADARPLNAAVNYAVANEQLRAGNIDAAWHYRARAESVLSQGGSTAQPDLAASVRLFPAYVAWLQDDPERMVRLLDQVAPSVQELSGNERRQLLRRLWTMYAAAGRLRQAEQAIELAARYDPGDVVYTLNTDLARADLFVERGDLSGLRAFAAERWNNPLPDAAPPFEARRLTFLIDAGLFDAAARDLNWFMQRTTQAATFAPGMQATQFRPFYKSSLGALEFARGRSESAVALLEEALPTIRNGPPIVLSAGGSQAQYAALKLALAQEALSNVSSAIAILEDAVEDRVALTIGNTPNRWLRASTQLARLYRKNAQAEKARTLEAHMLKILAAADSDHPLVMDLRRRPND